MKRTALSAVLVAALATGSVLPDVAMAQSSRVSDAELKLAQRSEQKEREKLDNVLAAMSADARKAAEQERWENATESVCRPASQSVNHRIEASRCKAQRYKLRRSKLSGG